jgi:hypothetical protein
MGRGAGKSRDPIVLEASVEDGRDQGGKNISAGAVVGIAIGGLAVLALTIGAIVFCVRCRGCRLGKEEECVYLYTGVADGMEQSGITLDRGRRWP